MFEKNLVIFIVSSVQPHSQHGLLGRLAALLSRRVAAAAEEEQRVEPALQVVVGLLPREPTLRPSHQETHVPGEQVLIISLFYVSTSYRLIAPRSPREPNDGAPAEIVLASTHVLLVHGILIEIVPTGGPRDEPGPAPTQLRQPVRPDESRPTQSQPDQKAAQEDGQRSVPIRSPPGIVDGATYSSQSRSRLAIENIVINNNHSQTRLSAREGW